jgi:glucose/arabinose dehydrogenase
MRIILLGTVAAACGGGGGNDAPPSDATVKLEMVASGLDAPLDLAAPSGDSSRLFVVEKTGRIRVIRDGAVLPTPFLDLRGAVALASEQGLLGLTFHPAYATNGRFFVDYTDLAGNTQVVGYHVSSNPDVADAASASPILSVGQPFANHNGGGLAFGPDGFLYVALGDGGSGGDPQGHGQNAADLLGSLLRIDVDAGTPYAIPAGNPFAGVPGARAELWNIGLRNPFRFSFDRANGDLYIGDVGQGAREEIDVAPAGQGGQNYGWNVMEGSTCFAADTCSTEGLTPPVIEYDHDQGCSVIGGFVYRGAAIPALRGIYFYGDFCAGFVRSFRFSGGGASDAREWPTLSPHDMIQSFGQDAAGEIYVLTTSAVFRIAPA